MAEDEPVRADRPRAADHRATARRNPWRSRHDGLAELVDLYPTLAELAGLQPKTTLDGVSLVPMLKNSAATVKDGAFTQVQNGYSVRTDRWRYTEWDEGKEAAVLYDMDTDPAETTNLAEAPAHAATVTGSEGAPCCRTGDEPRADLLRENLGPIWLQNRRDSYSLLNTSTGFTRSARRRGT